MMWLYNAHSQEMLAVAIRPGPGLGPSPGGQHGSEAITGHLHSSMQLTRLVGSSPWATTLSQASNQAAQGAGEPSLMMLEADVRGGYRSSSHQGMGGAALQGWRNAERRLLTVGGEAQHAGHGGRGLGTEGVELGHGAWRKGSGRRA